MAERMTEQEFIRFERRWKAIFTFFAAALAASIFAFHFGLVEGVGIFWCIAIGVISLIGALFAANELRDTTRRTGVLDGLEALGDDD
jgi:4-hydroxybenzoate polyprenyltransferase